MGLLQKTIETYDAHSQYVGTQVAGHEILVPVSHILARADIEIVLEADGRFSSARLVGKEEPKIPIPATEKSAGRTSGACAHPLCDYLSYICHYNEKKHNLYMDQLTDWATSVYTHPMLISILTYVKKNTILDDLKNNGIITLNEKGIPEKEDLMIRWRVYGIGTPNDGCWQQASLFQAFQDWYLSKKEKEQTALCMLTGEDTFLAQQHQSKIIPKESKAKLISANDKSGFTYRGRFTDDWQALTVGYVTSQKAHNALIWLIEEQGVRCTFGKRVFLCWNPKGVEICHAVGPFGNRNKVSVKPSDYRQELKNTLNGYLSQLPEKNSSVVIAAFDAATTGRLSVTYYNELMGSDYLERLYRWDEHCCWFGMQRHIQSPSLYSIVNCAFGKQITEKGKELLKADEKILGQQMQRLIACRVDGAHMPTDIMFALVNRASRPEAYKNPGAKDSLWQKILFTACAVIRKYRYDYFKEECEMELHTENPDRSYQFGRLLAVFEKVERSTYTNDEKREPYAIRMLSAFSQRPMYIANNIEQHLERAYFSRLSPASRNYYKKLIGEILEQIYLTPQAEWNLALKETYLMGYYLQRNELYKSKKEEMNEEVAL